MPRFVSVLGKLHPAEEVVQLPISHEDLVAGKSPVYKGPDRGALTMLVEQGFAKEDPDGSIFYNGEDDQFKGKRFTIVDLPGESILMNHDTLTKARTLGYKTVKEYLSEMYGIDVAELEAKQKAVLSKVVNHDKPVERKKDPIGSHEKSGPGPYKKGGFGDSSDVQSEAVLKGKTT